MAKPRLSRLKIHRWADGHLRATGRYPRGRSEPVAGESGLTWKAVDLALRLGGRGLPGGSSLFQLLREKRRARRLTRQPLTERRILQWADRHHRDTGRWPHRRSGAVLSEPSERWHNVDNALRLGLRGFRPGRSLALLLERHRGHRVWGDRFRPFVDPDQLRPWTPRRIRPSEPQPRGHGHYRYSADQIVDALNTINYQKNRGVDQQTTLERLGATS